MRIALANTMCTNTCEGCTDMTKCMSGVFKAMLKASQPTESDNQFNEAVAFGTAGMKDGKAIDHSELDIPACRHGKQGDCLQCNAGGAIFEGGEENV